MAQFESRVKGNLNVAKQTGDISAKSEIEGNLNFVEQRLADKEEKTSWWTKTKVVSTVVSTITSVLRFVFSR